MSKIDWITVRDWEPKLVQEVKRLSIGKIEGKYVQSLIYAKTLARSVVCSINKAALRSSKTYHSTFSLLRR